MALLETQKAGSVGVIGRPRYEPHNARIKLFQVFLLKIGANWQRFLGKLEQLN